MPKRQWGSGKKTWKNQDEQVCPLCYADSEIIPAPPQPPASNGQKQLWS